MKYSKVERTEESADLLFRGQTLPQSRLCDISKLHAAISLRMTYCQVFSWVANAILTAICVYLWFSHDRPCPYLWNTKYRPAAYSPANDATEYIPNVFNNRFDDELSPYQGWPTDDLDALWQDLYSKGASLRIDKASHDALLNKTEQVPLPGYQKDYFLGLEVFHQLHCLNVIRMAFYPRRYNSSIVHLNGSVDYFEWLHIDHCIESLRQSLMCCSDTSVVTYKWSEAAKALKPKLGDVHICRNFTKVQDWALEHYVDVKSMRARVEDGYVVNYTHVPPSAKKPVPMGWNKTIEDM